jgi:6-phosphogluconolactonase (cycloisomerase 2 family)
MCTVPAGGSCSAIYTVTVGTGAAAGDTGLAFHGTYAPILVTRDANATLHVQPSGGAADKFAYVVNQLCPSSGCVDIYTIDSTTGALTLNGSEPAGIGSEVLAADPMGKFLYVANSSDISMFTIDASSGKLTPTIPPTVPGGFPEWIGVHPSGKFAYLANDDDTAIDVFAIDSTTGVLTKSSSATACINSLRIPGVSVGLDPSGKFAYVPRVCSFDDILTFSIDQSTGALTTAPYSPASGSPTPVGLVVHPSGKFAYLVSSSPDIVTVYSVNSTNGELTSKSTANTGSMPSAMAIDPAGKFAYVTNQGGNTVSEYSVDQTTGALTPIGGASGVNAPIAMTIEHSGKFLYVVNGPDGCSLAGLGSSVQQFTIGTTGLLTPGNKVCADIMATQIVTTNPSP